jgi:hypothetical protein
VFGEDTNPIKESFSPEDEIARRGMAAGSSAANAGKAAVPAARTLKPSLRFIFP